MKQVFVDTSAWDAIADAGDANHEAALLYKEWSFTDCVSYVVMKQREITEAFTFDDHFAQMGFIKQP